MVQEPDSLGQEHMASMKSIEVEGNHNVCCAVSVRMMWDYSNISLEKLWQLLGELLTGSIE